jgi:hypothetical protein
MMSNPYYTLQCHDVKWDGAIQSVASTAQSRTETREVISSKKKVPEQSGLPFSGSTWQTAAYRTQRPNRHCCRSKGAATPRVNGLLHSEPYSAARTRLPLGRRLRAFLLASPAASASRRRNRLRRLLARLPAAGASACCSGWGYRVSPITVCYYTPSMTALSRGSPRIGGF